MSYGNQKPFDDRRICEECEKPFLYATEITEEIDELDSNTVNTDNEDISKEEDKL